MIGNGRRREVADRLRRMETADLTLDVMDDCNGRSILCGRVSDAITDYRDGMAGAPVYFTAEAFTETLAELIDRPTCHNTQTREGKGGIRSFTCSECGVAFDTMGGEYKRQSFYGILPSYCPNCGAEVER